MRLSVSVDSVIFVPPFTANQRRTLVCWRWKTLYSEDTADSHLSHQTLRRRDLFRFTTLAYGMPTLSLPDNFLPRATQLLLPKFATPDEREAWLAQAFFLNDPRLYHDLRQMSGAPIVYVTRCITALLTAKCIPGRDVHSLALLLNAVRIASAPAEQREIDELVTLLDPMCGPDSAPDTVNKPTIESTGTQPIVKPVNPLQTIDTPEDQRTPTVFISYAHVDEAFAVKLITDLQNAGHAIWIDTVSIKGGDAWVRSIADGIRNSYAFLTIISPEANSSRWVLREYLLAENLQKPIYPVLARQADIPFQMIDRQVVMLHQDYDVGLRELLETLPAPTIPLPSMEDVLKITASEFPIVPPAPAPAVTQPQAGSPAAPKLDTRQSGDDLQMPPVQTAPARGGASNLPDFGSVIGDILGGIREMIGRRGREKEEAFPPPAEQTDDTTTESTKKREEKPSTTLPEPPRRSQTPGGPAAAEEDLDMSSDAESEGVTAADFFATPTPNRRALELQYVQRQWAEAFSQQQDAPESADDMIVRWMKLSSDADLNADASGAESGHVDNVGAGLMSMRRAVVMGDSPRETAEAVWSALGALMQGALNDPTQPLPIIINLAKWSDAEQSLDSFVHSQLGELGDYWHGLLEQKRAALLFTGFEELPAALRDSRTEAIENLLRQHPELPVLITKVG